VLAVSCATGEYELVGIYHAGYSRGSSLNVVIQIDQARDMLTTLHKPTVVKPDSPVAAVGLDDRRRLVDAAGQGGIFFPFGNLTASVRHRDSRLVFDVYPRNFPTESWPALVIEDLPSGDPKEFGQVGRVWFGNARGLKEAEKSEMNADVNMQVQRGLEVLRRAALSSVEYRKAQISEDSSKAAFEHTRRLERVMKRTTVNNRDVVQTVADLMDREGPKPGEKLDLPSPAAVPPIDAGP
jgi:serine protease Do